METFLEIREDTDSHRNTDEAALLGPSTPFPIAGPITSLGKPEALVKTSLKTTCVVEPSYSLKRHLWSTNNMPRLGLKRKSKYGKSAILLDVSLTVLPCLKAAADGEGSVWMK